MSSPTSPALWRERHRWQLGSYASTAHGKSTGEGKKDVVRAPLLPFPSLFHPYRCPCRRSGAVVLELCRPSKVVVGCTTICVHLRSRWDEDNEFTARNGQARSYRCYAYHIVARPVRKKTNWVFAVGRLTACDALAASLCGLVVRVGECGEVSKACAVQRAASAVVSSSPFVQQASLGSSSGGWMTPCHMRTCREGR